MDEDRVSLEQWVTETSRDLQADDRELLRAFQKEWGDGYHVNPALYDLNMTALGWMEQFDWFRTVESFQVPGGKTEKRIAFPKMPAQRTRAGDAGKSDRGADSQTVIIDPASSTVSKTRGSGTRKQPVPSPASKTSGTPEELGDLETIILETAMDTGLPPASGPGAGPGPSEKNTAPPQMVDEGTVIIKPSADTVGSAEEDELEEVEIILTKDEPNSKTAGADESVSGPVKTGTSHRTTGSRRGHGYHRTENASGQTHDQTGHGNGHCGNPENARVWKKKRPRQKPPWERILTWKTWRIWTGFQSRPLGSRFR